MKGTSPYWLAGFAIGCAIGAVIANSIIFPTLVGYTLKEVLLIL